MKSEDIIWIVDDDPKVRQSLSDLLESVGYRVRAFESGAQMLAVADEVGQGCVVLDVRLGGESGLKVQATLAERNLDVPIVFVSGHADVPISVQAMKAGAIDFLQKPFREQDLLDAIANALDYSCSIHSRLEFTQELRERYQKLTRRERQVLRLVVSGLMNKQIAADLGISEVMVKVHRASVLKKMEADSLAELVRFGERLDLGAAEEAG
jgi:FixJ family two-component response regulator